MDCVFCKIARGGINAKIEYQDDDFIVFHDIKPKAPLHLLIVPKNHIKKLENLETETIGKMIILAIKTAQKFKVEGYRLQFNIGEKAGQEIKHLHLHLLGF